MLKRSLGVEGSWRKQGNAVILCVNWLQNGKVEELAEKVDNILKRKWVTVMYNPYLIWLIQQF